MKQLLLVCLMVYCNVSLAESTADLIDREVYVVGDDRYINSNLEPVTPLVDRPENIIRLDIEFPLLSGNGSPTARQKLTRNDSPISDRSPLTSVNNSLSIADPEVGTLTHMRPKTASDYDPLQCPVKWQWSSNVTVGKAVDIIANFMGYRLIIRDPLVGQVYSMPLPFVHRNVKHVDVQTALELLGGPGLMVVIDRASRTVMHRVRDKYFVAEGDSKFLPRCIDNLTFAESPVGTETGVLIVGGKKCTF